MQPFLRVPGESLHEFACNVYDGTATEKQFKTIMNANSIPFCTVPARFGSDISRFEFTAQLKAQCAQLAEQEDFYVYWSPIDVVIYFESEAAAALFKLTYGSV